MVKDRVLNGAKKVAFIAVMSATLTVGKLALAVLPNIEVVTLLCACYGYVFGIYGVVATFFFVVTEGLIYGMGTWLITYFIHWPFVAAVFLFLRKLRVKNRLLCTFAAVVLTVMFGVTSSLIDVGLFSNFTASFGKRFAIYYSRGVYFYLAEIITNLVLFLTVFTPLTNVLDRFGKSGQRTLPEDDDKSLG